MTVSAATPKQQYTGTNFNTPLSTVFPFFVPADLEVTQQVISTGVEAPMVQGTHYTVTGGSSAGAVGTITPIDGPTDFTTAMTWTIKRSIALTQSVDFVENDSFPAEANEAGLDRNTMQNQDSVETLNRALKLRVTDVDGSGQYDAKSNRIINLGSPVDATDAPDQAFVNAQIAAASLDLTTVISPFSATLLDDTTAAAWLDTLVPNQTAYDDWLDTLLYDQGGTSAVPRPLRSRLQDEVHVEDYGALPSATGAANSAAINLAILDVSTNGGIVNVGPGTYTCDLSASSRCILMKSNVWLRGQGPGATTIKVANSQDAHAIDTVSPGNQNVTISDMTIDGNGANQAVAVHCLRFQEGAADIRVFNVHCKDPRHYGLGFGASTTSFERIFIHDVYISNAGGDGIDFKDPQTTNEGIFISRVLVDQWGTIDTAGSAGIDIRGIAHLSDIQCINGNEFPASPNHGIRFRAISLASPNEKDGRFSSLNGFYTDGSGQQARGITVSGRHCHISNGTVLMTGSESNGILFDGTSSLDCIGNIVSNVNFVSPGDVAIKFTDDTDGNVAQGCHVYDSTDASVVFTGGADCKNNAIMDCTIINSGGSAAIKVGANNADTVVRGNTIRDSVIGISVAAAATDTVIQGNHYESNSGVNLSDAGTDTVILGDVESGITQPAAIASPADGELDLDYPSKFFVVSGTNAVTSIRAADAFVSREVILQFSGVLTFTDGNNLKLAGNFATSADDTIHLVCDGTDWFEIGRSAN